MVVVDGLDQLAYPTALVALPQRTRSIEAQEHHA